MQSEKVFGQYDKLRGQIVVLSHAEAVNDLVGEKDSVTGYFSSAPYTEIALADGRVHKVLSASDVIDGKASFLILGASKGYIASHPKVPEVVAKAIDEAARIIRDDPHRAAEIYLLHEPSRTLDAAAVAACCPGSGTNSAAQCAASELSPISWAGTASSNRRRRAGRRLLRRCC